jgi:hypothetical protein
MMKLALFSQHKRLCRQVNENISLLYVIYQTGLFAASIVGPGSIFMMMIGAMDVALGGKLGLLKSGIYNYDPHLDLHHNVLHGEGQYAGTSFSVAYMEHVCNWRKPYQQAGGLAIEVVFRLRSADEIIPSRRT